jgi:hypothetical protein
MKNTLFSLLFSAAILISCSDSQVSSIESDSPSYSLIKLPKKSGTSVETIFSQSKLIDGEIGGEIIIIDNYVAVNTQVVHVQATLTVPPAAFTGNEYITMTIDDEFAAASFSPSMVFNIPVELDLKFEGIDLQQLNLNEGDYDFVFIDDNGDIEIIQYDGLQKIESQGKIWVTNANLNHFSRYAFGR